MPVLLPAGVPKTKRIQHSSLKKEKHMQVKTIIPIKVPRKNQADMQKVLAAQKGRPPWPWKQVSPYLCFLTG